LRPRRAKRAKAPGSRGKATARRGGLPRKKRPLTVPSPRSAGERGQRPGRGLLLEISARTGREYAGFISRGIRDCHLLLHSALRELSIALVGDREMARLHRQFLGIDGPTDVLSFELERNERGQVVSGELVVCVPEARRRVRRAGAREAAGESSLTPALSQREREVRKELLLYVLHGMLHLSGFDDRTDAGFKAMHRTEDRLLSTLGIGPVFSRPAAPGKSVRRRAGGK